MRQQIPIVILFLSIAVLSACSNFAPTDEQVYKTIENDSIIAKDDSLELKSVSILSSLRVGQDYKLLLKIDFINHHGPIQWNNKSQKDFIPSNMQLTNGLNSVKATAILSMSITGDRSWYIENFSWR